MRGEMPQKEPDFKELAKHYLWNDYVDARSEYEEIEALERLLAKMYEAGRNS